MKGLPLPLWPRSTFALLLLTLCSVGTSADAGARWQIPVVDVTGSPAGFVLLIKEPVPAADDTGRNVRDRDDQTLTPMDQSNDPKDLELTRDIRKALMADDTLSTTAQNIKIITSHGKVTLRGPVATAKEKAVIGKKAQKLAKGRVDNQLEVTVR